jgi:hypothetical protein
MLSIIQAFGALAWADGPEAMAALELAMSAADAARDRIFFVTGYMSVAPAPRYRA